MIDLPLNALRAFAVVYECGGVRAAARRLGVAHSSVVRSLRVLENWLGVPLVVKNDGSRVLHFTPQGRLLAERGLAALRDLEQTVATVREAQNQRTVVLSTTPSLASRWLMPRLADLRARHAEVELSIVVDQKLTDFRRDHVDLCLRMGRARQPDTHAEPLMDDALFPVMSPAAWERAGRPSEPRQLARLTLIHDRDPGAAWELWRAVHPMGRADLSLGPRFAGSDLVLRAAAGGLGVALARARLVDEDLAAGFLIRPFGTLQVALPGAYQLVTPDFKAPSQATRQVITWLHGIAANEKIG